MDNGMIALLAVVSVVVFAGALCLVVSDIISQAKEDKAKKLESGREYTRKKMKKRKKL